MYLFIVTSTNITLYMQMNTYTHYFVFLQICHPKDFKYVYSKNFKQARYISCTLLHEKWITDFQSNKLIKHINYQLKMFNCTNVLTCISRANCFLCRCIHWRWCIWLEILWFIQVYTFWNGRNQSKFNIKCPNSKWPFSNYTHVFWTWNTSTLVKTTPETFLKIRK